MPNNSKTRDGLVRAYQSTGEDFLAYRLQNLFKRIETPTDIALHNDVLNEVEIIIGGNIKDFYRGLATLTKRSNRYNFLKNVSNWILTLGMKKG